MAAALAAETAANEQRRLLLAASRHREEWTRDMWRTVGHGEFDLGLRGGGNGSDPRAGSTFAFRDDSVEPSFERAQPGDGGVEAAERIGSLSASLLASVAERFVERGEPLPTPTVVLRGGLLMLDAVREVLGPGPWGFLLPARRPRGGEVAIERAELAVPGPDGSHLLVDTIVNTGETVLAALDAFDRLGIDTSPASVRLACVFLSERGERAIRSRRPELEMHTVWSGMAVGPDGRVSGVGFDAGDCAVGGGERLRWTAG